MVEIRAHRTRIAPSPTGALHLGNARTFLLNWAMARQHQWEVVLRIEDLDGPRIKPQAADETIRILEWLGIDWDIGPFFQRCEPTPYHEALRHLRSRCAIYPCHCTRTQIQSASLSAPNLGDHEVRYPGTCRPRDPRSDVTMDSDGDESAWRILVPDGEVDCNDQFAGAQRVNVQASVGDFLVATKGGWPSYQLAVVVDDARQGVDRIVRGNDLLPSIARQKLIYRELGLSPIPDYWHFPLVRGRDGRRLAKRHGDTRISSFRARRVTPQRILGLVASWCGIFSRDRTREIDRDEFRERLDWKCVPHEPIVLDARDEDWLLAR
jgi:glutamyl-tRNA synthetase